MPVSRNGYGALRLSGIDSDRVGPVFTPTHCSPGSGLAVSGEVRVFAEIGALGTTTLAIAGDGRLHCQVIREAGRALYAYEGGLSSTQAAATDLHFDRIVLDPDTTIGASRARGPLVLEGQLHPP